MPVRKTIGRRTGKTRYTPVNYAIIDERIYRHQGRHMKGKWFLILNIKTSPKVEVLLPSRALTGYAEEVTDPKEASHAIRQILKNNGLGGYIYGFNPNTALDDVLQKKTEEIPVIRIKPIHRLQQSPNCPLKFLFFN